MAKQISKSSAVIIAIVISICVYLAGVFSGLYANSVMQVKVNKDIGKVQQDIYFLKNYTDIASLDIKNVVLTQFFINNMGDNCKFSRLYIENLYQQLQQYWDKLPSRMEEYEKYHNASSPEYTSLKREYIRLSLRIWLIANDYVKNCHSTEYLPILYYYSSDCSTCISQGVELDAFKKEMAINNTNVIVFPIDINFYDDTSYLLREYYNITSVPSIVIHDTVIQGEPATKENLLNVS